MTGVVRDPREEGGRGGHCRVLPVFFPSGGLPPPAAPRSVPAGSVVGIDTTLDDDDNIGARRLLRRERTCKVIRVLDFMGLETTLSYLEGEESI